MPSVLTVIHTSMSSTRQESDMFPKDPEITLLHTVFKTCQTLFFFFFLYHWWLRLYFFKDTIRKSEARVVSCGSKQYVQQFIERESQQVVFQKQIGGKWPVFRAGGF